MVAWTSGPAGLADAGAEALMHRSDLLYCLARAFSPPPPGWSIRDWGLPLVDDLMELGRALALDVAPVRAAIMAECERWDQAALVGPGRPDEWLVEYARLFLTPPVQICLNAGVYLEGSVGGTSVQMMHACYQAAGFVPDESFHDLPDHVTMQLEFMARLFERAARGDSSAAEMAAEYAGEFIHAWAEPLRNACLQAGARFPAARVYQSLSHLVGQAAREG